MQEIYIMLSKSCREISHACIANSTKICSIMSVYSSLCSLPSFHTFYELVRAKKFNFTSKTLVFTAGMNVKRNRSDLVLAEKILNS